LVFAEIILANMQERAILNVLLFVHAPQMPAAISAEEPPDGKRAAGNGAFAQTPADAGIPMMTGEEYRKKGSAENETV
jgi:hypothetical protein